MTRKAEDEGERGCSTWLVVSLIAGLVVGLTVPINDTASTPGNVPEHCKPDKIEHTCEQSLTMFGLGIFCVLGHQFLPTNIFELQVKAHERTVELLSVDEYCGLFCVYVIQLFLLLFQSCNQNFAWQTMVQ